jgi:hypothetical protein
MVGTMVCLATLDLSLEKNEFYLAFRSAHPSRLLLGAPLTTQRNSVLMKSVSGVISSHFLL